MTNPTQPKLTSYLDFGSENSSSDKKTVYQTLKGDKAYDWLMLARYSNDIFAYHNMKQHLQNECLESLIQIFNTETHHKDDVIFNFNKLIALSITENHFFELGQTLFGCIEGMDFCNDLLKYLQLEILVSKNLEHTKWYGVDISDFFNHFADKLHKNYHIQTSNSIENIPDELGTAFAKGITLLYAIRTSQQLADFLLKSRITIFDYSLSLHDAVKIQIGTGKDVCYLSLVEFNECYSFIKENKKDIWVRGNAAVNIETNQFYFEGFVACEIDALNFISKQNEIHNALSNSAPLSPLIHNRSSEYWQWNKLSNVMSNIHIG